MKYVIVMLCLFSFAVIAQEPASTGSGLGSFFSGVNTFFNDVMQFLTVETPSMMQRFWAWAIEWFVMIKLYLQYESIKFSWGVAKVILEDLSPRRAS